MESLTSSWPRALGIDEPWRRRAAEQEVCRVVGTAVSSPLLLPMWFASQVIDGMPLASDGVKPHWIARSLVPVAGTGNTATSAHPAFKPRDQQATGSSRRWLYKKKGHELVVASMDLCCTCQCPEVGIHFLYEPGLPTSQVHILPASSTSKLIPSPSNHQSQVIHHSLSRSNTSLANMLLKQILVAALFTMGSVSALPEANQGAVNNNRRCHNDRFAYWDNKHRGCACRGKRRWDSHKRRCY